MRDLYDYSDPFRSSARVPQRRTLTFRSRSSAFQGPSSGSGTYYTSGLAIPVNIPAAARVVRAALVWNVYIQNLYAGGVSYSPVFDLANDPGFSVYTRVTLTSAAYVLDTGVLILKLATPGFEGAITTGPGTLYARAGIPYLTSKYFKAQGAWRLEVVVE